jgi:hypothetical protein
METVVTLIASIAFPRARKTPWRVKARALRPRLDASLDRAYLMRRLGDPRQGAERLATLFERPRDPSNLIQLALA